MFSDGSDDGWNRSAPHPALFADLTVTSFDEFQVCNESLQDAAVCFHDPAASHDIV